MRPGFLVALLAGVFCVESLWSAPVADALLRPDRPDYGWSFNNGAEFPGAAGSVTRDASVQRGGEDSLKLVADFKQGGLYVAAQTVLPKKDVQEISFWVKGLATDRITLRVVEASDRCHQFVLAAKKSPDWQQIVLPLLQYFERQGRADAVQGVLKYEAWGGGAQSFDNDGSWKGPGKGLSILIGNPDKQPVETTIWLSDVKLVPPTGASASAMAEDFEASEQPPKSWQTEGAVAVDSQTAFQGRRSLVLSKSEAEIRNKTQATGPVFAVSGGALDVEFAGRSDLTSMDNSYNATLSVDFFDAKGESLGPVEIGAWFRQMPWKKNTVQIPIPDGASSARVVTSINKETPGKFWLDAIAVKSSAVGEDDGLRRMMLGFSEPGHLLFPETPRVATIEVWSAKEIHEVSRNVKLTVRDYWGAEQSEPVVAVLKASGKVVGKDFFKYEASVDLSGAGLKLGRYYELHGEIVRKGGEPFSNYTSFAILPEAAANQYRPEEVPFTSRTWDQRFKESPLLTKRLGIRFVNVWGRMTADPAKENVGQIDLAHELGLGVVTSSPAMGIERRAEGWKELLADDGALIRKGVRNFLAKYGHIKPMLVNLGNEPHNKGAEVKHDVEAYRIVYSEIKKIDPSIFVVGTSVGLEEEYFKAGFGEWLDAYDFHSYEDPEGVRTILTEGYPEMFKKYGFAKPVWSTEIGMNSQGMTRQAVASLLYRKFANFFAGGGANVSWFGLFYPDPDAKIHGSFASAHNVFDCRYNKYAPKLDAIAYYNAVNSIAIKKFVTDKLYEGGSRVFLFRDRENRSLMIAYRDKGREDVLLPLPGVKSVEMIRLDGSRDTLDAGERGISLTISEDPVLLLMENGPKELPAALKPAAGVLGAMPALIFRDGGNSVEVRLNGVSAEDVDLHAPPMWKVAKTAEDDVARFALTAPPESQVREANLTVLLGAPGKTPSGLLSARVPVAGMLAMELLPVPPSDGHGPGVRLSVQNNSDKAIGLTWDVAITGEQVLADGAFSEVVSSEAKFEVPSPGSLEAAPRGAAEVFLPLANVKPLTVFHVKGTVRDDSGRVVAGQRPVAGFIPVPQTAAPMKMDGRLDEASWQKAPVQALDDADQFFGFKQSGRAAPVWSGPKDLSAEIRYLWDKQFLYVGVRVLDDVAGSVAFEGAELWRQDGLQFLIDPQRRSKEKVGKYEYSIGLGLKGPQTWCTLSADAGAPVGDAHDIQTAIHRERSDAGDLTYELAIPWSRVAPFQPVAGNNLGFTLIINDDDGEGRNAFMTWFGNAHTKDVDTVGDLILLP